MKKNLFIVAIIALAFFTGCVSRDSRILETSESQLKLRSIQTRSFETNDKRMVTRIVVATLQDLNFVIDDADADLGTVSATKLSRYQVKIRANARYNLQPIEDPQIYQDFFAALEKSLFLSANSVE